MLIPFGDLVHRCGIKINRVVHAGAHLAEEASAYADVGAARVLWVEGNPDLIGRIEEVAVRYGHRVAEAVLGAKSGVPVTLHLSNLDSMSSSVLDLGTHKDRHPKVVYVGQQLHTMRTLDEVASETGFLDADFLNLDLQGYELECLKGAQRLLESVHTVYTEVNVDELYTDCVLLPELDSWLNARGFEAAEVMLAGGSRRAQAGFVGWGDACYMRVATPRPFRALFPEAAGDWFDVSMRARRRLQLGADIKRHLIRMGTFRRRLS